ncbi:hypothetical protein BGW36DRAFT_382462 [Talaromyces proteolyticus]|uniref:Ankyrin n=1 Tax=Talaromyces proteolyticus TaxID=1131652 RepID=A0AAD4KN78_9EURO|nr:uncharacterized protein BGW36DRAFT_382462 [Talaromyces proteolyticus]KAH8695304.1 hypothetical protein BGW36DRAFT_382462 [Talaromyces proteolyticus]
MVYVLWSTQVYSCTQFIHLFRSAKALEKKLLVVHQRAASPAANIAIHIKRFIDKYTQKIYESGNRSRRIFRNNPNLLRNIDLCLSYLLFLVKSPNDDQDIDVMMSTAVQILAVQTEKYETVTGDWGFELIKQEINILKIPSPIDLNSLAEQLERYIENRRNFANLAEDADFILPPIHQLLLLTRSNSIIQAACHSRLLPSITDERDIFDRRLLETLLDEISEPDIESFAGLCTASEKMDQFYRSSLHVACMNGSAKVIEDLMNDEDDINSEGPMRTRPLHLAFAFGHNDVIEKLLEDEDLDVSCLDELGRDPMSYAPESECVQAKNHVMLKLDALRTKEWGGLAQEYFHTNWEDTPFDIGLDMLLF